MTAAGRVTVLLDVDGTLVDSNYLHVTTWMQVLGEAGHPRPGSAIHRQIGKDGDLMLEELLGAELAKEIGGELDERRGKLYLAAAEQLRPLPGAVELITELVGRGVAVVLATSAPADQRELLLKVLDLPVEVAAVTDADDVETAKPEPDLLHAAMGKVEADPDRTIMVGDAVWDVHSAMKAGIPTIGLLTGGLAASELSEAGAAATYASAAELLEKLEESVIGALLAGGSNTPG